MSLIAPRPAALMSGARLDRYELVCPIAEGGMGVCWLARIQGKHGFEKLVAIKTMKLEYANDPEFRRMFLDEARIASGIEHGNVAEILDLGEQDGVVYLVMEYVDGDSLHKLRREVTEKKINVPTGIALRLMADTLGGLHAAHELADASGVRLGVVHRDVSPQNILVSTRGVAKLIDFGIAKARERTAADTSTGTIKGKLHFMAPEQACGGSIDGRTDVFSIGAILYYLLANRYAYHADTQAGTVLKLASGVPPDPLPDTVAPPIATIVLRALAYNQSIRFPSAAAMQEAIEDAMVKTGYATTTSAVAAFMSEHLSHRAAARKKAIEQASEALAKGAPIDIAPPSVMLAVAADSSPGSESGPKNRTKMGLGVAATMDMAIPVSHEVPPAPPSSEPGPPPSVAPLHTDPGSPTIGAAMIPSPPPAAPSRKSGRLFAVGFVTIAVIGIGVGGVVTLRNRTTPQATRPEPTSAATAPPSTTPELEAPVPSASSGETSAENKELAVAAETAAPGTSASAAKGARPRVRLPIPAPSGSVPKKRRKVDDGF